MSRRPGGAPGIPRYRRTGLGLLSGVLLVVATALVAAAPRHHTHPQGWMFALLVAAFGLAEATQLHVEFRRETFSASLSEVPLVLALFVLNPWGVVLARLAGAGVVFAFRRTPVHKLTFNLALFAAEAALAAMLFGHLVRDPAANPIAMLPTFGAVAVAEIASTVAVLAAMRILGGAISAAGVRRVLGSVAVSGTMNTTLALVVLIVLRADPAAAVLLIVIAVVIVTAYQAHAALLLKHNDLGQLYDLSRELSAALTDGDARAVLVDRCAGVLRAERVVFRSSVESAGDPLLCDLLRTGRPRALSRRSRTPAVRNWLAQHELKDAVLAPFGDGTGTGGVLQVENRLGEMSTFTLDDVRMLETISTHADTAGQARRSLAQLRHDSGHDALTGVGNRTSLFAAIERLLADTGSGAVLLLDVDRFKEVNDALGHRIGDLLLRSVAQRLAGLLPVGATLARLGGDEFAVLLPTGPAADSAAADSAARDSAVAVATALRAGLQRPHDVEGASLEVGASIGVALIPEHGRDAMSLLQHADVAMYAAKRAAGGVSVYSSDDHVANLRRLALSRDLRGGVANGEIEVYYQPKVALDTDELVGVEALARWQSPQRGLVMPDEFIRVAEQTGLIAALTDEVLRAALTQVRGWMDAGRQVGVSVNLSARGLHEPGLPAQIALALDASGVPAELLTLEITESSLVDDFDRTIVVLDQLVKLGVALSLDDFGTGYSSLSYLQRLPVSELKIDKSFVWAMDTEASGPAIVRAVIELAHTLGLLVIAEGVEDERTRDRLADMKCDAIQGYLLSRPMSAAAATEWLQQRTLRIPPQQGRRGGGRLRMVC